MNTDIAWGILFGAVGVVGIEAIAFVWLAVASVRHEVRKRADARAAAAKPGLRVVDVD